MTASTIDRVQSKSTTKLVGAGAVAGLVGGVIFGILMNMMGALPMVGMLVGQPNPAIGFLVHMVISAIIGAGYGLIASRLRLTTASAIVSGTLYGILWWVLGALIFMPLMLGMNEMVLVIEQPQWMSLAGHILYGIVTALVFIPISRR